MCSATDSYDIALSSENLDICHNVFDNDPIDSGINEKLNFNKTFAFKDFKLISNPNIYEFSNIDNTRERKVKEKEDYFILFDFSAKNGIKYQQCYVKITKRLLKVLWVKLLLLKKIY